jgi:phospholipid/cholesterol/gamma-HCH transport system ATP-binding protein
MIDFMDVYKAFNGKKVLTGFNLRVEKGETFVIIGQSGIGKTVALRHLAGLIEPDAGDGLVEGVKMNGASSETKRRLREKMGVLFQSGALLNWMTVAENVALPLIEVKRLSHREADEIVDQKLELLQLTDAKHKTIGDISGGMKKRVALARLLVLNPEILLYDEPTTGLDPVMSMVINDVIRQMQREFNVTSLVVTHDMKSALYVGDRIGMLYEGRLIQSDTPEGIKNTTNPVVRQFIEGNLNGPIKAKER